MVDRYTKVVLTVIAVALVVLAVRPLVSPHPVGAQAAASVTCGDMAVNPCYVRTSPLVGPLLVQTSSTNGPLDVRVSSSPLFPVHVRVVPAEP